MAATPRPSSHVAAASCLFIILSAATTIFTSISSASAREILNGSCIAAERAALLSFKAGITGDPENRLTSWQGLDCCEWNGVRCDNRTGHVVKLDLHNDYLMESWYTYNDPEPRSLHGQISSSLLSLRHLKHLDLSGNFLGAEMPIPEFVGSLEGLTYLNLSNMNFIGRVPPQLGNLSKLVYLDIRCDGHTYSTDISWLARLHLLEYLDMRFVNLSTVVDWVHTVNTLPYLVVLNLGYCNLNSSTPSLSHHNLTVLEELDLSFNALNSPAAPNWFWGVTSLERLSLFGCELSGTFPHELGNLTLLETLDLRYNNIKGMIPATLKNLGNLRYLDISYNIISGDITDVIERLPNSSWKNLQVLYLFQANITGTTLKSVLNLTSLNSLDVSSNHLSGSVPVEIGTLTNLTTLLLGNNSLSGVMLEDHFTDLTNLMNLDLSHNYLEVIVDSYWVPPFNLSYFASCHLGPQFPEWLRRQKGIMELDMSNTGLVGRIPDWFWTTFSDATSLDISLNQLSGELPLNLEFMSVENLALHSNSLNGSIPQLPRTIEILDISRNSLNGFVPSNFRAPHLQVAILFSNSLTGAIPASICRWPELRVLDISNNQLIGELPDCGREELKRWNPSSQNSSRVNSTSSSNLKISTLLLSNNGLSGGFPLFLRQCRHLIFLDLTQNKFSGKLPAWISEDMPSLAMLRLRSNNFSGHIPIEITRLLALRILDLSNNNFSGAMPQSLENLKALTGAGAGALDPILDNPFQEAYENGSMISYMKLSNDSFSVVIKGQVLDYRENTLYLMSIDLSCNSLTGQIPEEIISLGGLINLNLSSNLLSGNIPYKIGNLRSLESLDLSKNQLAGEIPWGLSDLTSLSYLNLSYNNLSGRIPSGHQLDTLKTDDPASTYIGNPGLCGRPIPRQCPGDHPTHEDSVRWDGAGMSRMDFLLGLIVGFVAGVWMVFCGLLFMKRWRYAYFGLSDKLCDRFYVISVVAWQKWFRNTGAN